MRTSRGWRQTLACGLVALVAATLAASGETNRPTRQAAPAAGRHVALISLDGFAAYALADDTLPVPHLRALARDGARAAAMVPVNPTVTWPNHTAMVTGVTPARHGVLFNGAPVRSTDGATLRVEPHVDKPALVRTATVYDAAHAAGLTTAEVDWVAIERAPTITWAFSEWARPEGAIEREMIAAGRLTDEQTRGFSKLPITMRDEIWTRAAEHIVTRHRPNLLLFHLLTTDSVQHRYGAKSLGAAAALSLADAMVGRLVAAYREAGLLERTTFVVVSDHGFKTYKRVIHPNAWLVQQGLQGRAWVIPEGGTAMVYITGAAGATGATGAAGTAGATGTMGARAALVETLAAGFRQVPGVARVLHGAEAVSLGYPDVAREDRMADLVLAAADGHAFDAAATGEAVTDVAAGATPGSHGYLNTETDMHAIFVASGAGVKRGVTVAEVRTIDIAPTIAHWLGLDLPGVEGRVLSEIVR